MARKNALITSHVRAAKDKDRIAFWKRVDELLIAGCDGKEISSYFGISADTLYDRCEKDKRVSWSAYRQELNFKGDSMLREAQFKKAVIDEHPQMQIFLGKNRLGQTDRQIIQTEELKPQKAILKLPDNGRRVIPQGADESE